MPRTQHAYLKGQPQVIDPSKPFRCTQVMFLRISDVMRGEAREFLMSKKPTYSEAAKKISEYLDFVVTDEFVKNVNKVVQIWEPSYVSRFPSNLITKTKLELEEMKDLVIRQVKEMERLKGDIAHLNMLVHHLYHSLNERPPNGITIPADLRQTSRHS